MREANKSMAVLVLRDMENRVAQVPRLLFEPTMKIAQYASTWVIQGFLT